MSEADEALEWVEYAEEDFTPCYKTKLRVLLGVRFYPDIDDT
jgi:hypothetical protein